ncbi:MAG: hypothetical protein OEM07_00465 [Gammaproteobacteria bacterium]|nr:hypothetical protein [Gammaproteobacteria bacterium]
MLYGLQTSFPVSEGENPVYFKLQSLKTSADFSHRIPDGKFIDFENIQLSGPDSVSVESDIRTTAASFGTFELMTMNDFSSSFFIGFSHTELDAEIAFLSGSAVNKRDQINELYFDVGFWYQAIEELKLGFVMAFGINGNISTYSDIQLSLNYKLLPHMELVAGFRDFYYYYGEGDSTSNLIIDSRGPFMVLNFPF